MQPIGQVVFLSGTTRDVFRDDATSRQFILDDDGQPVYGTWILFASDEEDDDPPPDVVASST